MMPGPRPVRVAATLLWLAGLAAGEAAVETPFAVRQAAQELIEDLGRGGRDPADLVERGIALVGDHPDALLTDREGAVPLPEVIAARFAAAGLDGAFAGAAGAAASRALAAARSGDDLARVADAWPRTAAGRTAARRLADRDWDRGRIGAFIDRALAAGDDQDPLRARRLALARTAVPAGQDLPPATLAGLDPLWEADLGAAPPPVVRRRRIPGENQAPAPRWAVAAGQGLVALADGRRLALVEPLTGRRIALAGVGDGAPGAHQARPAAVPGGFAAAGLVGTTVVVVCLDLDGRQRWRAEIETEGFLPGFSNLAADDRHLVVAVGGMADEGTTTTLVGIDLRDGSERFRRLVARDAGGRFGGFDEADPRRSPLLARAGGGWLVCTNQGSLVRCDGEGRPRRSWTYPGSGRENPWERPPATRTGGILVEGATAAITPADARDLVLIIGGDGGLRIWRGDGAGGNAVALRDGVLILAGRRVTALDLAGLAPRWSAAGGIGDATAWWGRDRLLLAGSEGLLLLDPADGSAPSPGFGLSQQSAGCAEGVLVVTEGGRVRGFGEAKSLVASLRQRTTQAPADPLPWLGLAQLAQAGDDPVAALAALAEARARGAADAGRRAADLIRARAAATVGGPEAERWLAAMATNAGSDPALANEAAWWRGRDRWLRGERDGAVAAARTVLAGPDGELALPAGTRIGLHAAARTLLGQADPARRPPWLAPAATRAAVGEAAAAWTRPGRRGRATLAGGGLAIGYTDGVLMAHRIADGGEAWVRTPARPLLGVIGQAPGMVDREGGVPVGVLPGSSAAGAGLLDNDRILRLNGEAMDDFHADLRPAVLRMRPGDPFTLLVRRQGGEVELRGRLGGEPVEPVAVGRRLVLARATLQQHQREPGRSDNLLVALDLADGRELFTKGLPADDQDPDPAPQALIGPDDIVLVPDGPDLVGIDAFAAGGAAERWRIADAGALMAGARLAGRLLWLPDRAARSGLLVDPVSGARIARLPADGEAPPLVDGTAVALLGADRLPRLWDLADGALRWTGTVPCAQLLRLEGDQLLAITDAGQVAAIDRAGGLVRRVLGAYAAVQDRGGAGGDPLLLLARRDGRSVVLAVDPAGGTPLWDLPVPAGCEVALTAPGTGGAALLLRQGERSSALRVDGRGRLTAVASLGPGVRTTAWAPLASGLLAAGPDALRAWPGLPAATAARIPCPAVASAEALIAGAASGAVAVGRIDSTLAIAAPADAALTVHLGEGAAIDADGTRVEFAPGVEPRVVGPLEGWRLASHHGADGFRAVVLLPPVGRTPGTGLRLRVIRDGEDGGIPWWWGGAWAPVDGAP
jgi:hypothetical protein